MWVSTLVSLSAKLLAKQETESDLLGGWTVRLVAAWLTHPPARLSTVLSNAHKHQSRKGSLSYRKIITSEIV